MVIVNASAAGPDRRGDHHPAGRAQQPAGRVDAARHRRGRQRDDGPAKRRARRSRTSPTRSIVQPLIDAYASRSGSSPSSPATDDMPIVLDRVPTQQGTDLTHIRRCAQKNGFVFYVEPTSSPGRTRRTGGRTTGSAIPQPALSMNMGADTNVDSASTSSTTRWGRSRPRSRTSTRPREDADRLPVPSSLHPPLSRSAGAGAAQDDPAQRGQPKTEAQAQLRRPLGDDRGVRRGHRQRRGRRSPLRAASCSRPAWSGSAGSARPTTGCTTSRR